MQMPLQMPLIQLQTLRFLRAKSSAQMFLGPVNSLSATLWTHRGPLTSRPVACAALDKRPPRAAHGCCSPAVAGLARYSAWASPCQVRPPPRPRSALSQQDSLPSQCMLPPPSRGFRPPERPQHVRVADRLIVARSPAQGQTGPVSMSFAVLRRRQLCHNTRSQREPDAVTGLCIGL